MSFRFSGMLAMPFGLFTGVFCAVAVSQVYSSKIIFYHSSAKDSYQLQQAEKLSENSNFVTSRPTILYFHGFFEISDGGSVMTIVNAYKKVGGFNILILDWSDMAVTFYTVAALNIGKVGIEVAKFIQKMTTQGYGINNWHLVGYSLGAHLAGIVGRSIQNLSNRKLILPRITGLDPAFPGFYIFVIGEKPINKNDASFVDIIHTDAGLFGAPIDTGTIDFWPNDGGTQPGCQFLGCSHHRSVYLWAESVQSKGKSAFTSRNAINPQIQVQMGMNCPINSRPGRYKLDTNSYPPYSRG